MVDLVECYWCGKGMGIKSKILRISYLVLVFVLLLSAGCARMETRVIETTAYCGCGKCCGWERGSWKLLKLDFWNRYVSKGPRSGSEYSGLTASGSKPTEPFPGLFSKDSLVNPWMIPVRLVLPWLWFHRDGTIAADTKYYPFGTRMFVKDYGWGRVEDRGSAIKGPKRIDLYFDSHQEALNWGRKTMQVEIER